MNQSETPNPIDEARSQPQDLLPLADGCLPSEDLVAWLDDRLTSEELEAVERHLADCAACRRAISDCRLALAEADETVVPADVLMPWRALRLDRPAGRLTWPTVRRWGLAAVASVAVCLTGYMVGNGAVASAAVDADDPNDLIDEMSFGMFDDEDVLTVLQLVMAEEGEGT